MKFISYFFVSIVLLTFLVSCRQSKDKTTSSNQSIFVGTWETADTSKQKVTIAENKEHLFNLAFKNFDFPESSNLIATEYTNKELILKSNDKSFIYSFHVIEKNRLEFYFSSNSDENLVGESPPITLKKVK